MNRLKSLGLGLAVVTAFSGCGANYYYSSYNGYNVTIKEFDPSNEKRIIITIKDIDGKALSATDSNKDGRYDVIDLSALPKDSPLEQFANPQSLKEITDKVMKEAEQNKSGDKPAEETHYGKQFIELGVKPVGASQ